MITLIIARHGNTFNPGDIVTRVGARTDLPLSPSGEEQARLLGTYLKAENLMPDEVYASRLQRTQQTANLALAEMGIERNLTILEMLDEIDYGPDENKPEDDVIARIGAKAIENWDKHAIPPEGWLVDPERITQNWLDFATRFADSCKKTPNIAKIGLVLTSNGVGRFAPKTAPDYNDFLSKNTIKLSTGNLGILDFLDKSWHIRNWNIKPASLT